MFVCMMKAWFLNFAMLVIETNTVRLDMAELLYLSRNMQPHKAFSIALKAATIPHDRR